MNKKKISKDGYYGGVEMPLFYDKKYDKLNLELYRTKDEYFCINFFGEKEKKFDKLLRLHIIDAIELKSIIDRTIQDANNIRFEELDEEIKKCKNKK